MKMITILLVGAAALAMPAAAQAATMNNASNTGASVDTIGESVVSSVPNTEKKYKRSNRASDFRKEAETTRELNQQIANANGTPNM